MKTRQIFKFIGIPLSLVFLTLAGCSRKSGPDSLTLYSGRSRHLLQPLIDRFVEDTGIKVNIRYGGTAELAATIIEEGKNSPADIFFAQDSGSLGAVAKAGAFNPLPESLIRQVPARFRSPEALWIGISGRARVIVYNPERVAADELPQSLNDLTDARWRGRIGWAPMNASFQSFVTALRVERGEAAARQWLIAMQANQPQVYARNPAILTAVDAGEVDLGLINHYYLHNMQRNQGATLKAANHIPAEGTLINVAGVGILKTSRHREQALILAEYLLDPAAQLYFSESTFEYPLARGAAPNTDLTPLETITTPFDDLSQIEDLEGTLKLLRELNIL